VEDARQKPGGQSMFAWPFWRMAVVSCCHIGSILLPT
jgi:hypothetical protein